MKKITNKLLAVILLAVIAITSSAQPKREFRGAWIQCVNGQFQGIGTEKMQKTLTSQLDELQKDGVNAIIFQVRAECDALYPSKYEPWSRFLTGTQGTPPSPYWDPLQWMITECHKRGMELHAWINPFRAKTKTTNILATNHIAITNPECCFDYDGLVLLNPALQSNRDYICKIASDIVTRYDIDGLHIDDYFYPYPVTGQIIPDDAEYAQYNNGIKDISDWRRYNVNQFVQQLHKTIHDIKPWVKFGVSPFGIYRNNKTDPKNGSNTNGLENYDGLYADVLLWVNNGWIDYCAPQIYWEIGNKSADYDTLIHWWNKYASHRPLYIGEDVERTVKYSDIDNPNQHQMIAKYALHNELPNVNGTILWYAKTVVDDTGKYGTLLREHYWKYHALQPKMTFIDDKAPSKVKGLQAIWTEDGYMLVWLPPKQTNWEDASYKFVVYEFDKGEKINIDDPKHIVDITTDTFYKLPYEEGKTKKVYVVTVLDRMSNESGIVKRKVKL